MSARTTTDPEPEHPSRSQRKREHLGWQALAAELAMLPDPQLRRLGLEPELEGEIRTARAMKASGARNRQLRHVAQRLSDACDQTALRTALAAIGAPHRLQTAREQRATELREQVLRAGASATGLPLPETAAARLDDLRAIALKGSDTARSRHARREIYRLILGLIEQD